MQETRTPDLYRVNLLPAAIPILPEYHPNAFVWLDLRQVLSLGVSAWHPVILPIKCVQCSIPC